MILRSILEGLKRRPVGPNPTDNLKGIVPTEYHQVLMAALNGNKEAAKTIAISAPAASVGKIVVGAFEAKMPPESFRALLHDAWSMNHGHVMDAAQGNASLIRKMFNAAQFDCSKLPDRFPIYRGVKSRSMLQARPNLSWTTNRDAACWFATTFSIDPIVLRAEAARTEVIYYSDDRNESEVILSVEKPFSVDGEEDEWRSATTRHMESLIRHNDELRSGR